MGTMTILRTTYPRLTRQFRRPVDLMSRIGDHMLFYVKALAGAPHAAIHFRKEIIRLIAEISMGAGTLAMIGGTVVIVGASPALIAFTSGTTGAPKGVVHSHQTLGFETRQLLENYPPDRGRQLTATPVGISSACSVRF